MEYHINNVSVEAPDERLLMSYVRGESSAEEASQVEYWVKCDDANEKILLHVASIHFAKNRQQRIEKRNSLSAFEKNKRKIINRQRITRIYKWSVAASCILFIVLFFNIFYHSNSNKTIPQRTVLVQVNPGMRNQVELPDGTLVYLNSGSTLSYPIPYDTKQRDVTLTGEAFFKVARHDNWPFIAKTADGLYRVKVTGTEFNMQAFENDTIITTTLVSGIVDVLVNGSENSNYQRRLSLSEKTSYNKQTGKMKIEKINPQYETAWIDGKIMFRNCPLPEVLKKLSYHYNVKFEVKNPSINEYRLTGVFDNKQLSQILDYLQISSNIKYQIRQATEDDSHGIKHSIVTLN